ncbi:Serine/threonine-protein kinase HT1 [Termitomyces sp. T112]|nr:Serine/threonine-protein kinase HT1 [Termitomyces sp. T112]
MSDHGSSNEAEALRKLKIVIRNEASYRQLLQSRGHDAQALLNMFQKLMDNSRLDEDRKSLIVATERLSRVTNLYPLGFTIRGIKLLSDLPHAGGGYADIYKGEVDGLLVCMKWIRTYQPQEIDHLQRKYSREAILWRQLSHPNVLPFLGLSLIQTRLFIVSPWAENGHVNKYLRMQPTANRPRLCLDVAAGLKYLHHNDIVHGDLKGANILVNDSGRACVADFGLSSVIDPLNHQWTESAATLPGGTMNWQAPELFDVEHSRPVKNTTASDIYAWACVCYEIFTGERPFFEYPIYSQIPEIVLNGKRPSRPTSASTPWTDWGLTEDKWRLMEECWLHDPMTRPTIDDVVRRIEGQMQEDTRPTASWAQIVLTRPRDEVSLPRALEIMDEILQHQYLSHFDVLPPLYPPPHILSNINENLPTMGKKQRPLKRITRKTWIICIVVTICIVVVIIVVVSIVKATAK